MSIKGNSSSQQENKSPNESSQPSKPFIERGASWSYNETRILLSLWGQDMVQRQLTNSKRTRHVWEKITERIREHGYERTSDQVRTRVFNMIAEYRRILKDPTPERKKKCVFFDALEKIYQAKDSDGVKAALNMYDEDYALNQIESKLAEEANNSILGDTGDGDDNQQNFSFTLSPFNTSNGPLFANGGLNLDQDDSCDDLTNVDRDDSNIGRKSSKRLRSESNENYQNCSANGYLPYIPNETAISTLLIDRMFKHLTKEMDMMRECMKLEKERSQREASRRKEESDREERREKAFLQTLMKLQEQSFSFLTSFTMTRSANEQPNPRLHYHGAHRDFPSSSQLFDITARDRTPV